MSQTGQRNGSILFPLRVYRSTADPTPNRQTVSENLSAFASAMLDAFYTFRVKPDERCNQHMTTTSRLYLQSSLGSGKETEKVPSSPFASGESLS